MPKNALFIFASTVLLLRTACPSLESGDQLGLVPGGPVTQTDMELVEDASGIKVVSNKCAKCSKQSSGRNNNQLG